MWPFSTNQKAQVLAKRKSCLNYFYRIGFCGFIDRFLTQEANTWVTRYYLIKLTQRTKVSRSCTGQLLRSGTKHNRLLTGLVLPPVSWRNPTALGCCCSSLNDSVLKASATELKVDFEKTLSAFQNFLRQIFFPAKCFPPKFPAFFSQESDEGCRGSLRVPGLQQLHLLHQPKGRRGLGGRLLPHQRRSAKQSGDKAVLLWFFLLT